MHATAKSAISALLLLGAVACHDEGGPRHDLSVSDGDLGAVDAQGAADADVDAAPPPVGFILGPACIDHVDEVYTTPFGLPALTPQSQGDVVRCFRDAGMDRDAANVDTTLKGKSIPLGASPSGLIGYRIGYRTSRADGTAAMSTARVYVPTMPKALPLPVVVAGHATEGVGDGCAPSKNPDSELEVALPWAALGYAVIEPDYTGMGDEGIPGYVDNRDQGYALLDGARALRKLFPTAFSDKVVIAGWSQGGGAALSAQALARTYGAGGTLAAVVAFSPEWPIRYNSFAFVDLIENPDTFLTFSASGDFSYSNHVIWALRAYGFFASFSKLTTDGGAAFPAATAATFLGTMDTVCGAVALGGALYIQAHPPGGAKNGDLFDPTFRTQFVACLADPASAGCSGLGQELYDYFGQNHLKADATGAPILYLQGLSDTVLPPATEAACIVQKLVADGASPQVCVDSTAKHTDVTNRNIAWAIGWVEAVLAGTTPPGCAETAQLPAASCN